MRKKGYKKEHEKRFIKLGKEIGITDESTFHYIWGNTDGSCCSILEPQATQGGL